jgi:hypothetical protein
VPREQLGGLTYGDILVQPRVDFRYEVSFYYVDDAFQYALHAPDPERRWALEPYEPTAADLAFARCFIGWSTLNHGIQSVDAGRIREGELLRMLVYAVRRRLSSSTLRFLAARLRKHRLVSALDRGS